MVRFHLSAFALILFSALISPMSFAKSVSLKTIAVELPVAYGTLRAEIHFDERDLDIALRTEKIIRTDLIKAVNYFQHVPENTVHFNVDPYLRLTNGNATVFPTNIINLYKFPASNNEHLIAFDDWLRGLIFHEYIHILHLDQTRGFLEVGRKIFGSFVKIAPAMTPRWFPEGIAVWSETYLLGNGGRLENPLFRKELLIQFLKSDTCSSIDCLDEPGVYPGGQLAYWAGAHFMEYLEKRKPGTIKCLVEDNSDNFMFMLNDVFRFCTGAKAQQMFAQFRAETLATQPPASPSIDTWGESLANSFGSDDLEKGIALDGNILFKVERNKKSEALVSYDLQENVNMMISKFSFPISDIAGITTMATADEEQSGQGKFLIVAFNEDPRYREANRVWKLINTETLLVEAVLPLKNDPSYVIGLGNNRFLTASFIKNKWKIERQRVDVEKGLVDAESVYEFSGDVNLTFFKKQDQKIFLKFHNGDKLASLVVSDLTLERFYKLYQSPNYFDLPVLTDKFVVVREKENLKLLEFDDNFRSFSSSEMDKDLLNRVTIAELNDSRMLVLENNLKTREMNFKDGLGLLKKGSRTPVKSELLPIAYPTPSLIDSEQFALEKYPRLDHMRPYYWFLSAGTSDNLFSVNAFTSLSDPMGMNVLNAEVITYPSEAKVGGSFDFTHKFSSLSDLWSGYGMFNREYTKTDFNDSVNITTDGVVGTRYAFLMKRWSFLPGIFLGSKKTTDFVSSRSIDYFGVSGLLTYGALSFDDYFQSLFLQVNLQDDSPDKGDSYRHLRTLLKVKGRFAERLELGVQASFGKLFKDSLSQGDVISAGGTNTIGIQRWHEFYGLPYGNAYGNEIFTFRAFLDYNTWNIYQGPGLFPVYFKELHLLLGSDTMTADRIILDKSFLRNETIHSVFIGPKIKMNVFYFVPVDLDLIYSSINHPRGGSVNSFEGWISLGF